MYNAELKQKFVDSNLNDVLNERFLRQLGEWEDLFQKDCCNFTVNEIIAVLKGKSSISVNSLIFFTNTLKRYTDWCMKQGYVIDGQNHYAEITNDILLKCLTQIVHDDRIITRNDILSWLSSGDLRNASDAALMLAVFEGICGKEMSELIDLSMSCFKDNTVTLSSGRTFEVSTNLISLCEESTEEITYNTYSQRDGDYKLRYLPSNKVFKAVVGSSGLSRKTLYNKLIRIQNALGLSYLSTHSLLQSGRIEMIQKLIKEGNTLDQILNERITEYRYGKIQNISLWKKNFESYI